MKKSIRLTAATLTLITGFAAIFASVAHAEVIACGTLSLNSAGQYVLANASTQKSFLLIPAAGPTAPDVEQALVSAHADQPEASICAIGEIDLNNPSVIEVTSTR